MAAKKSSPLTPEQSKTTLMRVLRHIRPYTFFVVCSLVVAAASVAAQLYIPILCGNAIDLMLGPGQVDLPGVVNLIWVILLVMALAAVAQWALSVCNNRIAFSVSRDLRNAALRKIQSLPLSYLDSHPSGDIVSAHGERAHHPGGGLHHPAELCGGRIHRQAQLPLFPGPDRSAGRSDRPGQ